MEEKPNRPRNPPKRYLDNDQETETKLSKSLKFKFKKPTKSLSSLRPFDSSITHSISPNVQLSSNFDDQPISSISTSILPPSSSSPSLPSPPSPPPPPSPPSPPHFSSWNSEDSFANFISTNITNNQRLHSSAPLSSRYTKEDLSDMNKADLANLCKQYEVPVQKKIGATLLLLFNLWDHEKHGVPLNSLIEQHRKTLPAKIMKHIEKQGQKLINENTWSRIQESRKNIRNNDEESNEFEKWKEELQSIKTEIKNLKIEFYQKIDLILEILQARNNVSVAKQESDTAIPQSQQPSKRQHKKVTWYLDLKVAKGPLPLQELLEFNVFSEITIQRHNSKIMKMDGSKLSAMKAVGSVLLDLGIDPINSSYSGKTKNGEKIPAWDKKLVVIAREYTMKLFRGAIEEDTWLHLACSWRECVRYNAKRKGTNTSDEDFNVEIDVES